MARLAVVDVGSNAIRLLTAETTIESGDRASWREVGFKRYALRLGGDVFADGAISRNKAAALHDVFSDINAHLSTFAPHFVRAVGTSAMRDARNGQMIAENIRRDTGILLEIISGDEESRLSRQALIAAIPEKLPANAILVDLGGGSMEVERPSGRSARSLAFGTVRLLEDYPQFKAALPDGQFDTLVESITMELKREIGGFRRSPWAVGTGGNLNALARLLPPQHQAYSDVPEIDVSRLRQFGNLCGALDASERVSSFGIRDDRADLLPPAVAVVLALCATLSISRISVPGSGLREGIMAELAVIAAKNPVQPAPRQPTNA